VAVILNRLPAVFDTAHIGFVFTDVMRDGHCGGDFLGMQGGQQQHANRHNDCGCQRENTVRIT
jgi:hypothetical protein